MIIDLSSPEGASINDGIDPKLCLLSYVGVDDTAHLVEKSGTGAYLVPG